MTLLVIPPLDATPWPTLGPEVVSFIETFLVFGPGDLRGQPARVDAEQQAFIYRAYEVHPHGTPRAGKRRFQRCGLCLRKGTRKTELAAWLAAVELHPDGPVRCDGFRRQGGTWVPIGRSVTDPYIPMLAYTEDQSEELAFGALKAMIEDGPLADDFDVSLERIMRLDGRGKAEAIANAPDSADGARTTFQSLDETHRMNLARQREAHKTMLANTLKRPIADPWTLETTTMYLPGEGSVAEGTHDYARRVAAGQVPDSRLFYFYRGASPKADISTRAGLRAAVVEASGPDVAEWSDIDGIVAQWDDPDADRAYLDRTWLNRPNRSGAKAFDVEAWGEFADPTYRPAAQTSVTLGFDGSKYWDATALVATEISTGFQWPLGIWARPDGLPADIAWEVPQDEVDVAIDSAFRDCNVWRLYADPAKWESQLAAWAGRYGEKVVLKWDMSRRRLTAQAYRAYASAIVAGDVTHSGDPLFTAHIGNAYRRFQPERDDDGAPLWVAQKERPDSEHKIDASCAGMLSWRARLDAVAAGLTEPATTPRITVLSY